MIDTGLHELGNRVFCQIRHQDAGRGVQIILRVATNKLFLLGKGHVALNDAWTHSSLGNIWLGSMLSELRWSAAVAYGEQGAIDRLTIARHPLLLQRFIFHAVKQRVRTLS
ncbi:MAG: hypothetical protein AAGF94_07405 [Pseudomonadota bacterium]